MISSMFEAAWILFVTACSRCWNPSLSASTASPTGPPGSTLIMSGPSQLEYLVALQHLRPPFGHARRDLLHDEIGFARLQMRDVDVGRLRELGQLLGEETRAQMLGGHRELALPVRERRFDDQVTQVVDAVHVRPQRVVRRRVAGEDEARGAGVDLVADG